MFITLKCDGYTTINIDKIESINIEKVKFPQEYNIFIYTNNQKIYLETVQKLETAKERVKEFTNQIINQKMQWVKELDNVLKDVIL